MEKGKKCLDCPLRVALGQQLGIEYFLDMKKPSKAFLFNLLPETYRFAFALLPDDLQAHQVLVDAFSALFLQEKDLVESCLEGNKEAQKRLKLSWYRRCYQISVKRFDQLQGSLDSEILHQYSAFYSLSLKDRAILFLKYKTSLPMMEVASIVGLDRHQLMAKLYASQNHFLRHKDEFAALEQL